MFIGFITRQRIRQKLLFVTFIQFQTRRPASSDLYAICSFNIILNFC